MLYPFLYKTYFILPHIVKGATLAYISTLIIINISHLRALSGDLFMYELLAS